MKLFAKADAWLPTATLAAAGVTLTVTRNGVATADVPAVVGQTAFVNKADGATRVTVGDRDYIVRLADFPYPEPALGDRFTETVGGVEAVYEVMTPDTGEPAWRLSEATGVSWRIHAKQVS